MVANYVRMFPALKVDVDSELKRYKEYAEIIRPLVVESVSYICNALKDGKKVLVEGANAAMLDIDFGKPIISVVSSKFYVVIILWKLNKEYKAHNEKLQSWAITFYLELGSAKELHLEASSKRLI